MKVKIPVQVELPDESLNFLYNKALEDLSNKILEKYSVRTRTETLIVMGSTTLDLIVEELKR